MQLWTSGTKALKPFLHSPLWSLGPAACCRMSQDRTPLPQGCSRLSLLDTPFARKGKYQHMLKTPTFAATADNAAIVELVNFKLFFFSFFFTTYDIWEGLFTASYLQKVCRHSRSTTPSSASKREKQIGQSASVALGMRFLSSVASKLWKFLSRSSRWAFITRKGEEPQRRN